MSEKIEIDALERAALAVSGRSNCNQAWLDTSEDVGAAVVGHINEDGSAYPVATIDCDQYCSGDSLPLAKFYAAANPAAVLELIRQLRAAQNQLDALLVYNQTRTDELQAAVEQTRQVKDRFNVLTCRIGVACEVQIVSGAYDRIRAEKSFAIDDLEYDLFAEGWKTAIASVKGTEACLRDDRFDNNLQGPCSAGRCAWPNCAETKGGTA